MTYAAKILADSIAFGVRLVTMEVTFPRFILAEFNTHRMLSRNSASSRAIPVEKRIEQVRTNPFVPEAFTKNKRGMQADAVLDDEQHEMARIKWLSAAADAVQWAGALANDGVHKQHANRLLEPFCWHTVVVTATEWDNFFALRCHPAAQPEMQITARLMRDAMEASDPVPLAPGEWHLPYVDYFTFDRDGIPDDNLERQWLDRDQLALSVVRCAAVSYERQTAERTLEATRARHDEMVRMGHWSPFEHQAKVATEEDLYHLGVDVARGPSGEQHPLGFIGNFRAPWRQYRKTFAGEAVFRG